MSKPNLICYRNYIIKEDLEHFLPVKKADKAFEMLDVDDDGKVNAGNKSKDRKGKRIERPANECLSFRTKSERTDVG